MKLLKEHLGFLFKKRLLNGTDTLLIRLHAVHTADLYGKHLVVKIYYVFWFPWGNLCFYRGNLACLTNDLVSNDFLSN